MSAEKFAFCKPNVILCVLGHLHQLTKPRLADFCIDFKSSKFSNSFGVARKNMTGDNDTRFIWDFSIGSLD